MIATIVGRVAVDAGSADSERHESVRHKTGGPDVAVLASMHLEAIAFRAQRRQKSRSPGRARYKP